MKNQFQLCVHNPHTHSLTLARSVRTQHSALSIGVYRVCVRSAHAAAASVCFQPPFRTHTPPTTTTNRPRSRQPRPLRVWPRVSLSQSVCAARRSIEKYAACVCKRLASSRRHRRLFGLVASASASAVVSFRAAEGRQHWSTTQIYGINAPHTEQHTYNISVVCVCSSIVSASSCTT